MIRFDTSFHQIVLYKIISFAYSWILMKLKIEVIVWKIIPPPTTHTSGGGGAYQTYLASKDNYLWMQYCSVGPLYAEQILSSKINLFGYHKMAWCPWQPIKHCSWVRSMYPSYASRPEITLACPTFSHGFSCPPLIQEKRIVS